MRSVRKSWAIIGAGSLAIFCTACATRSGDLTPFAASAGKTPALNAMTYFAHANLLERQGVFKRAAEQYHQALLRQPRFPTAMNRLGITLNKLGRHEEASQVFRDAIDARPEQSHVHNNLAFSLLLEGKLTQAESAIRRALELNPKFKRARMNHGIILAKLLRFDEAFAEFTAVASDADAYYNLAMVQADAGMYAQACDAFRRTLELKPDMQAAQAHLNRLTLRMNETEIKHAADETLKPDSISLDLPSAAGSYSEIAWDSTEDESPVDAETADAPTDLSDALDRAFAKRFGDEDDDEPLVWSLDSEIEELDRPALPPPADAPVSVATFDSESPIDFGDAASFECPYAKSAAEAATPPVEAALLDVDPLPVEFDPIALVADVVMSLLSSETVGIDDSEATDWDMEWADSESSIATAVAEPAEPAVSSEDVQRAIDAMLVEAEYLAELLFALQDDLDPDYAFELTREVDSIIAEQLSDVAALDELRCELLERELEVESSGHH